MMEFLCHPSRGQKRDKGSKKSIKESKKSKRKIISMERATNINTKQSLDKSENNSAHHDNRDISEHKEKNTSNHSPQIIQKFEKSQVLTLEYEKY